MTVQTNASFQVSFRDGQGEGAITESNFRDLADTLDLTARAVINVKDAPYRATGDGATDDTNAIQSALNAGAGKTIRFPSGSYRHGPLTVTNTCTIIFDSSATVVPIFDAVTTQKLYAVTASGVEIDGLTISNVSGITAANKYLIHVSSSAQGVQIRNTNFTNITLSDGTTGLTNLLVVHGLYADSGSDLILEKNRTSLISGAAVFCRNIVGLTIRDNHFTNTRWYSITLDSGCTDFLIENNVVDGTDVLSRHWGGSINLMSQVGGTKNKRGRVVGNTITGKHNYGAAIRVLSAEDTIVAENKIYGATSGTLNVGTLQYIGVDRRGTAEGSPENGPCINVTIENNILTADVGPLEAIYIKNQFIATRSPHLNIVVRGNQIFSTDTTSYFEGGIWVSGSKGGIERVLIEGNNVVTYTVAGSPQGGAIGVVSTNSTGIVKDYAIINNTVQDVNPVVPTSSVQVGIFLQTFADVGRVEGNKIDNYFHGLRTLAGLTNIYAIDKNIFTRCVNDTLFGTASSGLADDISLGSVLPITGCFRQGHKRYNQAAATSTSNGWQVTTAGGAMTGAWASSATYVAGVWYRNASNRVYELITAGGGTTSVSPSGVVLGIDETGADGYTWRCRALAPARWSVLPALGAEAALP